MFKPHIISYSNYIFYLDSPTSQGKNTLSFEKRMLHSDVDSRQFWKHIWESLDQRSVQRVTTQLCVANSH